MRELAFIATGQLQWREREPPTLQSAGDAIVRPIAAGRCDGDRLPIHRPVSRVLQAGIAARVIDPVVACICGRAPFKGPFAIGHECVAEVIHTGAEVTNITEGQRVVVPWAVSCGTCPQCRRALTSKCATTSGGRELAAYGFGAGCGDWGGMVSDLIRVPFADHMLQPVPDTVPTERVAAASDNLADGWRAVVPALAERPGGTVLVLGGGASSIGLYAAGLAVAHGAERVDYLDISTSRRTIAESFGAHTAAPDRRRLKPRAAPPDAARYDVVVEATSTAGGLRRAIRSLAPGGECAAVGYYLQTRTGLPLMRMYATSATLKIGVSHPRAVLPELLAFVERTRFPAEQVTTLSADWDDAPTAYAARTTKVVLTRDPLTATAAS